MNREDFISKHGAIKIARPAERYFARLRQPHLEAGEWRMLSPAGPPILDGHFYTTGYLRAGQDPQAADQPWAALDRARRLTKGWARKLRAGECYALQSEGDGLYFPFVSAACTPQGALDIAALGAELAAPVSAAYARGAIRASYDPAVKAYDLRGQECMFWPNNRDAYHEDHLEPRAYAQYREVSARMLEAIRMPVEVQLYPDFVEFPVIYGGQSADGLFIGVITSCVWT